MARESMSRELVLSRVRASQRVRQLSATAIRVAVSERCGVELDSTAAELLARNLTPGEAVDRFREQAKIPRDGMGKAQRALYLSYIIATEAIGDTTRGGTPVESRDRELLNKIQAIREAVSDTRRTHDELERLADRLKQAGSRFRRFVRRADRLFRRQLSKLRVQLFDSDYYDVAEAELTVLYTNVYQEALEAADETLGRRG